MDPSPIGSLKELTSSQAIRLQVVAKSTGSEDPDFKPMDHSFKTTNFSNEKNVFANLSLGLNYCTIGPSQPPSRDTVPLNMKHEVG
jgi:hypothetical protein